MEWQLAGIGNDRGYLIDRFVGRPGLRVRRQLSDQPVIISLRADPEPEIAIVNFKGERAIM
jgi:hypothetical protein